MAIEDDSEDPDGAAVEVREIVVPPELVGQRLDKALAASAPGLSRARLQALMGKGRLTLDGAACRDLSAAAAAGTYQLEIPPPTAAEPEAQDIALTILYEDEHLIVVDKAAGMAVHPAPGTHDRTLVNALLHHCRDQLSGIGGVARPGIVHRLDKDTSGVMLAAKTDAAHAGLSDLFSRHDIERAYIALARGSPHPSRGVIQTLIGRSPSDRRKMAVLRSGGREAVTEYKVERDYGPPRRPSASRITCRLKTGRTHQIRVHLASKGSPCLGDPVYGSGPPAETVRDAIAAAGLKRQALHAAVLGFRHPITGEVLRFETPLPADMARLQELLEALS